MVMLGPGKPYDVFAEEYNIYRQLVQQQIGGASPSESAKQNLTTGAVALYSLSILQSVIFTLQRRPLYNSGRCYTYLSCTLLTIKSVKFVEKIFCDGKMGVSLFIWHAVEG
jgi:hypothetical protein